MSDRKQSVPEMTPDLGHSTRCSCYRNRLFVRKELVVDLKDLSEYNCTDDPHLDGIERTCVPVSLPYYARYHDGGLSVLLWTVS